MTGLSRSARLLVLIGIVSVVVAAAPQMALAERVKATLTFTDGNGGERPIRRESGTIDFEVPPSEWLGPGAVYGLRVYAINPAAIVRFLDRPQDAMYAQPGPPGAEIQKESNSPSGVLEKDVRSMSLRASP